MKIYCSSTVSEIFNRIIGKDLWIRVDILESETWAERFYKRYLIQIDGQDSELYYIKKIHDCTANHKDGMWHCSEIQKTQALNEQYAVRKEDVKLIKPVEIYTTDELFNVVR